MYDYRETSASRIDHQRAFDGRSLRLPLSEVEHASSFIREVAVFKVDETERYFPGMFQNLILPQFDVRWGSTSFRKSIESFRWNMVDRLRYERRMRPHDFLRLSLSHTRSSVFAPHVVRSVDESTQIS